MSFPRRTQLVSLAVLALAVAAVGAPASFAQEDPYSGEGYGGTMDGGSPLSHSSAAAAEQASIASVERELTSGVDSVALDPWMQAALKNRAYRAAQHQPIPVPQPPLNARPGDAWNGLPSDPWADACATFRAWGWALQAC
jgi:hypothetical protein